MHGMQQKLLKSCARCIRDTWHIESSHILQPPQYLIVVVKRFIYKNNSINKDRGSIPIDMTTVLGPHRFSLHAIIDHHGPSMYSGHYTASINCCNKTFYCNDNRITELRIVDTRNSTTAYVILYKLIN